MEWKVVNSSWVASMAYSEDSRQIYVRFHDGHEHEYDDCSQAIWDEFSAEETSPGSYIHRVLNLHAHRSR